ncbi:hypothetical protein [Pedobacter aquatilis]|uniref:hypothetical protein n=1 Tax=Pedobacter aquatilis TaxID=351343 RepID=UPI002930112B|nr:hypothetical protein [Pedobacter aquatilis]
MRKNIIIFCTIFWAGLIAGISFLEAPLKFQAPGITIKLGLGIGQLVFQALNKIEVGLLVIILFCASKFVLKNFKGALLFIITIILITDTFWLLPLLDARAKLVLSGSNPTPDYHHVLYIILECFKFLSLTVFAFLNLKDLKYEK